jgi:hypothetical protein
MNGPSGRKGEKLGQNDRQTGRALSSKGEGKGLSEAGKV